MSGLAARFLDVFFVMIIIITSVQQQQQHQHSTHRTMTSLDTISSLLKQTALTQAALTHSISHSPPTQAMDQRENNEIDAVLEQQLLGATFDADLSFHAIGLQPSHQFNWNRIMDDPKGDHGVYEGRGNWYKTMKYEVLHSGGFLRLYTLRGRVYWNGQNETEHTTPDWKLHFSCELDHIGVAWNALAALFMDMKCEIGMKSTTLNAEQWSSGQRGREITVYIYRKVPYT